MVMLKLSLQAEQISVAPDRPVMEIPPERQFESVSGLNVPGLSSGRTQGSNS